MKRLIYIIAISSFIIVGCEKDDKTYLPEIKMGNSENLNITPLNLNFTGGYYNEIYREIDIENDGEADYKFTSYVYGTPGLGTKPGTRIESLHCDALVYAPDIYDTTYLNITSETHEPSYGEIPPLLITYVTRIFTCERISPEDSIVSTEKKQLVTLNAGDEINTSEKFRTVSVEQNRQNFITETYFVKNIGDTSVYNVDTYDESCRNFPDNQVVYIGIKCNQRLGWIKLSIEDNFRISIYETAIQK